jgi:hypothetical protein
MGPSKKGNSKRLKEWVEINRNFMSHLCVSFYSILDDYNILIDSIAYWSLNVFDDINNVPLNLKHQVGLYF